MRASLIASVLLSALPLAAQTKPKQCIRQSFDGQVKYGQQYSHPIGKGLEFVLDPLPSGWLIRVLPTGPRPPHDYAELATPPYESVTPLAISTDFSFRAQDALAWNPRRFRFAADATAFRQLLSAYNSYMPATKGGAVNRSAEAKLTVLVQGSASGELRILDSQLIAGTADQAGLAATVASHLAETPHTVIEANGEKVSPLGRVTWIRFKVDLVVPVSNSQVAGATTCY